MNLIVYWTRIAESKLDDIFSYYETNVSSDVAKKIVNGIIDKTIGLENNPFVGQKEILLEKRPQGFRYLIHKSYKIIYWVNSNKNRIEIANVFDSRQNPTKINKTK